MMNKCDGEEKGRGVGGGTRGGGGEAEIPTGWSWAREMFAGETYWDTWVCDDSDKSPRRQNKAGLPQICFQSSSVGEWDDRWTGTERNTSVSVTHRNKDLLFSFPSLFSFFFRHLQFRCLQPISFQSAFICFQCLFVSVCVAFVMLLSL